MRILLTNDDGLHAQGLQRLKEALEPLCELWTVAHAHEQSATSHSLTLETILRRHQYAERVFAVSGTPADSVLMAINGIMNDRMPDLVISGVNHGPNMGEDVHYSGTVAAAIEAGILGIPAVDFVARMVREQAELLTRPGTLLNINVPSLPPSEIRGLAMTHLGTRYYGDVIIRKMDPREKEYFWIGGEEPTWKDQPDSDFYAVHHQGKISVTPLRLDLTDQDRLSAMRDSWEGVIR